MNMPPQVARFPPPSAQHFDDPGFVLPPFQPVAAPRRPERPAPLPLRSFRDSLHSPGLAPPQRAFPADGHGAPPPLLTRAHSSGHSYGRDYGNPSEHMLRRKTPNGTLAAGYDGTPVQWAGKAPPLKHVVLPLSVEQQNDAQDSRNRPSNVVGWSHNSEPNLASFNTSTDLRMNSDPGNWAQYAQMGDGNLNLNAWNNIPLNQPTPYFANNNMQIPTVGQPAYQISQRPTISNAGGLYGPYWPDGNFVPYRPAAYRGQDIHYLDHNPSSHDMNHKYYKSPSELLPPFPPAFFQSEVDSAPRDGHLPFLTDNRDYGSSDRYGMPPKTTSPRMKAEFYSPYGDGSRTPTTASPGTGNLHFKEKTLSWAHSIYVDLLAYLHQSKKDSKSSRPYNGGRTSSKNNIYPKPPRQPAYSLGSSHYSTAHSGNSARPSATRSHSQSSNTYGDWDNSAAFEPRYHRTTSSDSPHYAPAFQSSIQPSYDPVSKAHEALEMLTNLCEQSGWVWIDGMLLGGCLAYGLDQYNKALDWYSKIIALEPKHVEAMSNLAATLLCLNRREEAEQHWLQSVRLRPAYFEAVEHLIGLLCNEQRGKEAVSIIDFVERSLRMPKQEDQPDYFSETSSNADRDSISSVGASSESMTLDFETDSERRYRSPSFKVCDEDTQPGFGSSGFLIPGCDNGRMLALVHAKGNMLYALGDINRASKAFEDAVLISSGKGFHRIHGLIRKIISVLSLDGLVPLRTDFRSPPQTANTAPLLLPPERALQTARMVFAKHGDLPGLRYVPEGVAKRAAVSTTSNSLLSLAKIFQDAMSNSSSSQRISRMPGGVGDILALYYLSLSLQPSPSTANNVGILLAGVQQPASYRPLASRDALLQQNIPGVVPGSGVALALAYYNYGLNLDNKHAHIYTNLGSLLKDIGQLTAAISMYEKAVQCDSSFDIALANLANAVKDQGRTSDAIEYYRRAVKASPDFAEAVCGLANALNSVCDWRGRGGVILDGGRQDRYHVDDFGMILDASSNKIGGGWMKRVVDIVGKQLRDGSSWGRGTLQDQNLHQFLRQIEAAETGGQWHMDQKSRMQAMLSSWMGRRWEGARLLRLIERATKRVLHRWYVDRYIRQRDLPLVQYARPQIPAGLSVPSAPTVLPFHTFTCPLPAKDIRMISQRNALRISCSTLRTPWVQNTVFTPPDPPAPHLNVGYVSSDFNNHPLAHLMQSVFGFHNPTRAKAFCYATTASDNSSHRQQIEREAPVFYDASSWSAERLVQQILRDKIHILVNLNGYTRGARNEVFAARAAPIQMSFMGFAGTLGAEWCDYLLADETAIPPSTLRPWRRNIDIDDQLRDTQTEEEDDWVYSENIIFCRDTFFCCDHAQSEPRETRVSWEDEQTRRWQMRKDLFPSLSDDAIILGNFNQLYKIEPTTFRSWLRILDKVPKAILWLLRFPDLGESNLKRTAREWAGEGVASRIWFTDVAPKHQHISRARVCDLFLDTPECNAHTTAADILWSSTPLLTLPRYEYKMCSRMAASILKGALPRGEEGRQAAAELIAVDDQQYEEFAIKLASNFSYTLSPSGRGQGIGRLADLRKLLYESRYTCALFDTRRWVRDLEEAYEEAWRRWVADDGGDIYL